MAQPTLFPESGFRRLRIDIAYDGTAFFGWATQPDHRTIQDHVEHAICVDVVGTLPRGGSVKIMA